MNPQFITIKTFDNPVEANIVKAKLMDAEIYCFLKDENYVSLNLLHSNLVGGIKLQVSEEDAPLAIELLNLSEQAYKKELKCEICYSDNVHFLNSRKNVGNWLAIIYSFIFCYFSWALVPLFAKKVYYCENCKNEYEPS